MSLNQPTSPAATTAFAATRWSLVLAAAEDPAGDGDARDQSRRALGELARIYWFPLYAYVRRHGRSAEQAEDLTQEFFARLLDKRSLTSVDRSKGKFRCFLLAALKHFLANEWDKQRAQKRGGGVRPIALDSLQAEARYAMEVADNATPDRLFERRWALALLDHVLDRLRDEYLRVGKEELFDAIKESLTGDSQAATYCEIARQLQMSEGAVKVAAHRLRGRYRDLLRDEIAQTVERPELVEEEIAYLLRCL